MQRSELYSRPHRRKNLLTGEWILVSPQRTARPWRGEVGSTQSAPRPAYDPGCYLCPGNTRAGGIRNPAYTGTYVFTNDFPALVPDTPAETSNTANLLHAKSEKGICRVVNFSPRHDLTLADLSHKEVFDVITVWQQEFESLGSDPHINSVQIFENKGAVMGNSNPHPHCQIWAQESIPMEPLKEGRQLKKYHAKTGRNLLVKYIDLERRLGERMVYQNNSFVVVVPFWAVWPYETMVVPKKRRASILDLTGGEKNEFADALRVIASKYDSLFQVSFPYSSGLHQAPTDAFEASRVAIPYAFLSTPPAFRDHQEVYGRIRDACGATKGYHCRV